MKILRLIFGAGILLIVFKIGLKIHYIYAGVLLVMGAVLVLTSFGKGKK